MHLHRHPVTIPSIMTFNSQFYFKFYVFSLLIQNVKSQTYDYEDAYTLNYYFPMIFFFVVNFIVFLSGCTLFGLYLREERQSEILKGHRENQEKLAREAAMILEEMTIEDASMEENTIEDDIIVDGKEEEADNYKEERLNLDGMFLALDATGDEVEIALAK